MVFITGGCFVFFIAQRIGCVSTVERWRFMSWWVHKQVEGEKPEREDRRDNESEK